MSIRISPLLIAMGLVMFVFGRIYAYAAFLIVVVLHELVHAFVAQRLGYKLLAMSFTPSGASLSGEFYGIRRRDEVLIAVAGPIFNLITGLIIVAIWWLAPNSFEYTLPFVHASFVTFAVNLLPIFPLDGGRVMLAILSKYYPRQRAYRLVRLFGIILATVFFAISLISVILSINISLAFMSSFVLISVIIPDKTTKYARLYTKAYRRDILKKGITIRQVAIHVDTLLVTAIKGGNSGYISHFYIMDDNLNTLGVVSEVDVEQSLSLGGYNQTFAAMLNNTDVLQSAQFAQ